MPRRFTVDEYLRLERDAPERSEFIGGEMFARVGGTLRHAKLGPSFGAALSGRLRGKPCQPFGSDVRL
ncbi:MAG: hypothetical protein HY904_02660 [Deltaproteobacteria bacterium]|nr:hypothetical protein [Deltaproteobacteria bacterium]